MTIEDPLQPRIRRARDREQEMVNPDELIVQPLRLHLRTAYYGIQMWGDVDLRANRTGDRGFALQKDVEILGYTREVDTHLLQDITPHTLLRY